MTPPMTVLPADPKAGYLAHRAEIDAAVRRVLEGGWYILGPEVEAFEREFAAYLGVGNAVGVGTGTDALFLALKACGVGPGDAVATVSHTAVATVAAVEAAGATPVLVDIDPGTYTMDPGSLEDAVNRVAGGRVPGVGRLKAVIPVHLYGTPADMTAVGDIARRHGLSVIEDCAQAHGATLHGRRVGGFGHVGTFSFYPTKNLGALGDGGAVTTTDPGIAARLRSLREYGWKDRYVSAEPGFNSRLDELQAAILRVKLGHLDADNDRRRRIAATYHDRLGNLPLRLPHEPVGAECVYHQYVVAVAGRDEGRAALRGKGIGTGIHYPVPVHLQPAYAGRLPEVVPLTHTEDAARTVLSLPMYPELDPSHAEETCRQLIAVLSRAP